MCFPGSEIQKKCFGGDRCVSRSDEIVIYRETKKMSIAAIKQKLLRIVFRTYMCFPGSEIQKKCFVGDRCVSLGDLKPLGNLR